VRAILCKEWGGPERLVLEEIALRDPAPGEVKIRVRAAGINFPDVLIIQKKYQVQPVLPFTPGAEVAGEVIGLGEGVEGFRLGERVIGFCSLGGFAEEAIAPAAQCVALPDSIAYAPAAGLLLAYGTSWHALHDRAGLKAGETLLVLGAAGGVGLAAIDIGRAIGARVIAAASSAEKLAICRDYGAEAGIDYGREDLRAAIARLTEKRGPEVIYDPVGGDLAEPAFRSIGWRGRYLVVGFAGGAIPALPLNLPLLKGASVIGVFWGGHMSREAAAWRTETAEMLALLAAGRLRPLVSKTYPLEQVPQALRDMAERRVIGKIVVEP